MFSRKASVKLKAILLIDLMIIGSAAGAYFYLQNQGAIGSVTTPAKFTLKDLTISPSNATIGEAVQISVNATNIGDLIGNVTVDFEINSVVENSQNVTLAGAESENVTYNDVETAQGTYNVQVGDLTGSFTINPPPPGSSNIILSDINITPIEVWPNQMVTVTASAKNPTSKTDSLFVILTVDKVPVESKMIQVNASSTATEQFTFNATTVGQHTVKLNTLSDTFSVIKTGYHTLMINRSGGGSIPLPFKLNGVSENTPFDQIMPDGQYTITVPSPFTLPTGVLAFSSWQDGDSSTAKTIDLNQWTLMVATYTIISGYASCPSLFVWNGTGYSYVTDVSIQGGSATWAP